jgi:nitronate monooxygenase
VICQGVEAGGHVQSTTPLATLLPQVLALTQDVPVVAAGGLGNGGDISWALNEGATAVMLGTRFVATKESRAHALYKEAIVNAKQTDTSYSICFDGDWPYAAHRVLRNETLNQWESAGCPPSGSRPGEQDSVARMSSGEKVRRYSSITPTDSMTGDVLDCSLYAGTSVGKITDIPKAKELVLRMWNEANV